MEENKMCQNIEKCPIYSGILRGSDFTTKSYKMQYCEAGSAGWRKCKRFQVKEKTGTCPPEVLPNSVLSVEEIMRKYGM